MSKELTKQSYNNERKTKGIILFDVNWGRRWGCADFENAQLIGFTFDRKPYKSSNEAKSDLIIGRNPSLFSKPTFLGYALMIEPGEYALSSYGIKFARSVSDIGVWGASRNVLIRNGEAVGGSFKVSAGEMIFIGNFFLDCIKEPKLWRYYTKSENFDFHLRQFKNKYPYIDTDSVIYRLFETKTLGQSYKFNKNKIKGDRGIKK
jgi:hypothetical protein